MDDKYHCFYEMMEGIYDDWKIPHRFRFLLRMHELNFVGLMNNNGTCNSEIRNANTTDKEPKGRIFQFSNKQDTVTTARRKWLCAIKDKYNWFWDVLHCPSRASTLSVDDAIKFEDIKEIVKFINPKAYYMALNDNAYIERMFIMKEKARDQQAWAKSRHKFF